MEEETSSMNKTTFHFYTICTNDILENRNQNNVLAFTHIIKKIWLGVWLHNFNLGMMTWMSLIRVHSVIDSLKEAFKLIPKGTD